VDVTVSVLRDGTEMHLSIKTSDRNRRMRAPRGH
jgi:hypothetical protein